MRFSRFAVATFVLLTPAGASWSQPPSLPGNNPSGNDPRRRPVEDADNDIIGRTNQIEKAMEAAAEARRKESQLRARPAKAADIVAGAQVTDRFGAALGSIADVAGAEVVIAADAGRIRIPAEALGKSSKGLLIDMDKKAFDKLVAEANAAAAP